MVEKPKEGICSQCGKEELEFYDDGSGSCINCGRVFRWNHEQPDTFTEEHSFPDLENEDKINFEGRKNKGFTPSRLPAASMRIKAKNGFLYISIIGIVLLMIGYTIIFGLVAGSIGEENAADEDIDLLHISLVLNSVGVLVLALGLIYGAATAEHLDNLIRGFMLLAMAIILGLFLTLGTSFMFNLL